jgi:hypothetical protein
MTTINLSHPIAVGPAIYNALVFRRPKFGDMQLVQKACTLEDLDDVVALVARLADVPFEVAASIDPVDLLPVLTALKDHLEAMQHGAPTAAPPTLH